MINRKSKKQWQNVLRAMQLRPRERRGGGMAQDNGLDRADPQSMAWLATSFLEYLQVRNYSARSISSRSSTLQHFLLWCQERELRRPQDVTRLIIESYQRWLFRFRQPNGKPLGIVTQQQRITTLKTFFRWLCRNHYLLHNPASEIELPRGEHRLPPSPLSLADVENVLSLPHIHEPLGLRDRAIMEVLYSTAIRRSELCHLDLGDLMADRALLNVRQGKGKKDRVVPIGQRALFWVGKYLDQARPQLEVDTAQRALFLSAYGDAVTPDYLSRLIARYIGAANLGRQGSCHLFRHTCATLMLENGADIRYIQQMLGHANLETTAIYTEVTVRQLQKVHALTHPTEKSSVTCP
jgi:integrase/recombinase XerD